ncbi:radical SAM/SPASM domain-containing protein [Burkholderia ubonensis]|uniref:radical SAM/SPASM domain-containing protein n=1 Tax=Burkholderia ubonensis TaxID=101571 RepID=UPI000AF67E49|nr:radical SAM/SPASM domain-containing protein [Burkholderia ubonensis]
MRELRGEILAEGTATAEPVKKKVDLIYNTTLVCPWDCEICCVDAVHVQKRGSELHMHSRGLGVSEVFPLDSRYPNIYAQAAAIRSGRGQELDLAGKKLLIDNLRDFDARIDISGGDALTLPENLELLRYAAEKLGRDNVTLTVTGAGSAKVPTALISPHISEYNFTFDAESLADVANRPDGYALGNLKRARDFIAAGCKTRAELPLTTDILADEHLQRLYQVLHDEGVSKLLLMRLFPVGRGVVARSKVPTRDQYLRAIDVLKRMEARLGGPVVKLQCAMKHLLPGSYDAERNPCDLVHESFGIMPDGTLLSSPWAYGLDGQPLGREWVLGNLAQNTLQELLSTNLAERYRRNLDANFGHCKIFAYQHSDKSDPFERIFDSSDPLYTDKLSPAGHAASERIIPIKAVQGGAES